MLFRGPMGGGAASGKMGAMVAARNKGGQYLRQRAKPTGAVASEFQQVVRNALASLVVAWTSELDAEQRAGWATYALNVPVINRLGDSIHLSGQNWFIACNTPRLQAELTRIDDAPVIFDRGTPHLPALAVTVAGSDIAIAFGGTLSPGQAVIAYQSQPFSAGRSKYYGAFRLLNVLNNAGSVGITGGSLTSVLPLPGAEAQGVIRLVISQTDGRLSTPLDVTFPGS